VRGKSQEPGGKTKKIQILINWWCDKEMRWCSKYICGRKRVKNQD